MTDNTKINQQDSISQLLTLKDICQEIYNIRNVMGMGYQHLVEHELNRIDHLFKPIKTSVESCHDKDSSNSEGR